MSSFNKNGESRPVQFGDTSEIVIGEQQEATVEDHGQEVQSDQVQHKEGQRKDRAKKRIQQLSSQKNAAEQEAANYKRMYEETVSKMQSDTKVANTSMKTAMEQQYSILLQQMGDAIRSGEADKVVQLQTAMFDIKLALDKINTVPSTESVTAKSKVPAETPVPRIPELARMWIEDHPAFKTDELFNSAAITINNQLLREGYDAESEDFYDLLSSRLAKRFPEVFGTPDESVVQYKGDDSTDEQVVKPPVHRQVRTQEQVVSGSARPSANTIRSSKSSSSQVNFEKNDSDLLNAWGLDPVRVANRIKHNEANRQTDGYVPIIIPRNQ